MQLLVYSFIHHNQHAEIPPSHIRSSIVSSCNISPNKSGRYRSSPCSLHKCLFASRSLARVSVDELLYILCVPDHKLCKRCECPTTTLLGRTGGVIVAVNSSLSPYAVVIHDRELFSLESPFSGIRTRTSLHELFSHSSLTPLTFLLEHPTMNAMYVLYVHPSHIHHHHLLSHLIIVDAPPETQSSRWNHVMHSMSVVCRLSSHLTLSAECFCYSFSLSFLY